MALPRTPSEIISRLQQWLWSYDHDALWINRFFVRACQILYAVIRDLKDGQLSLRAMSLVYTTVIAIVPLLALSFSVLKGFGMHNQVEPALLEALVDLGDKRFEIVSTVMGFIDNIKVGVLGAVGFALLIYSVISMMHKIENSFNYTWQIKRDRNMSQRFRDYLSVVFVGPLMIFLSAAITTSANTSTAMVLIEGLPYGADFVGIVSTVIPYLMMAFGFAFIYLFLPNTTVKLSAAFVGGLTTAVVWKIMGWGVSTFVANSASNIAIYSAFASVIILMVWMYIGWLVLLIGASVSFYFQNPQYILVRRDALKLSHENYEKVAVAILYQVGLHYSKGLAPWTVESLGKHLHAAPHVINDLVDFLELKEYIVCAGEGSNELYPKKPLENIMLNELLRSLRENSMTVRTERMVTDAKVDDLFDDLRGAIDEHFANRSLQSLIDEP